MLEQQKGEVVTGGQLAGVLEVSRNAVWKAIRTLQGEGNEIVSLPNSGYKLMPTNDTLIEQAMRDNLTTAFVGRSVELLSTVYSTNQYLKEMDAADMPNGHAVIADEQTQGRGRRGRVFLSPRREGLYISVLLKPEGQPNDVRLFTMAAAVAVVQALEAVCGIRADIKWVNDILCGGRKLCGILTEAVISGELQEVSTAVIGIGINTGAVPAEIADIATSVWAETGLRGVRNRLAAEVLNWLEAAYLACCDESGKQGVLDMYKERLLAGADVPGELL